MRTTGRWKRSTSARRDDADHALVPALVGEDVAAPALLRLRPFLDLGQRLAQDPVLDALPLTVQLFELVRELPGLVGVLGEQELQGGTRPARAPGRVDPRRESEPDRTLVDPGGIDTGGLHQRPEPRLLRSRERPQARERERPVLVDERDDIRDRCDGDQVEMARERLVARAEQRFAELVDDAGSAELRKGVLRRARRHDGAVGERLARPMVVGDDHFQAASPRLCDLLDRGHAAVDGEHEAAPFVGESRQGLALDAVALLEAARQVPGDVGSELAQDQDGERRRADPVRVVVAVDADALAAGDRDLDRLHRTGHVTEQKRVVSRHFSGQEGLRLVGVAVPATDEHASRRLADLERLREGARIALRARFD